MRHESAPQTLNAKPLVQKNSSSIYLVLMVLHRLVTTVAKPSSSSVSTSPALLQLKNATLHPFTASTSATTFAALNWTIQDGDAWAVVGPSAARLVEASCLGRSRADPPRSRTWPFLQDRKVEIESVIHRVKFRSEHGSGSFQDWTARWGGERAQLCRC